jgi:dephospho-CoA kinase
MLSINQVTSLAPSDLSATTTCQTESMLMIGLTGGIGAGKSSVAKRLEERGAIVIDSDALARAALGRGTDGLAEVVQTFGDEILTPDGDLDRAKLAQVVFADPHRRQVLESIVHPRVHSGVAQVVAAAPPEAIVVNDVPLLVEAGLAASYDMVIVVLAAEQTRLARLTRERAMSEAQARSRISAQASDAERRAVADVIIENDGSLSQLWEAVDAVWREHVLPALGSRGRSSTL